jgi:hypothetical protein
MVMDPTLILSVVSAVTAAVWSVWTWREEQQKERQVKRDQESGLFVNPFIVALEELQLRLYGILAEDDLAFSKQEDPEPHKTGSPLALEILYRLSQYFGWGHRAYRYGPYTNDPTVIELVRKIGDTFESHARFPGDAFRFTLEERMALGEAVVRRLGEAAGVIPSFEALTLFQFQADISDKASKHNRLYNCRAVRRTLAAIDGADRAEALEGRERLAVLQNLLVDLITYLEGVEGFSVALGKRRRVRLRGAPAEALAAPATAATVVHQIPGRIRLRVPRLKVDATYAPRLQVLLESLDNVSTASINAAAASVVVSGNADLPVAEFAGQVRKTIETGCAAP